MVRYNQSIVASPAVPRTDTTVTSFRNVAAPHLQYRTPASKPENKYDAGLSFDSRLEKQNDPNQHDLFQLVHKKINATGRTGRWVDVEAGYGHIGCDELTFVRNTGDLERPGCAYLKANFSF